MDDVLYQLIYVSAAKEPFSEEQLKELLAMARVRNAAKGLSGLLVYERGSFLQVLEGTKPAIDAMFVKIKSDKRHHRLVKVSFRQACVSSPERGE